MPVSWRHITTGAVSIEPGITPNGKPGVYSLGDIVRPHPLEERVYRHCCELSHQNGAPLRPVVPWKHGFKSSQSIVKIRFVERHPRTRWMKEEHLREQC